MQDRYVGNVVDFGKLALLRCLKEGRRLAVCWYLTGGESGSNQDGKSFDYLARPDEFRHLAPEIFDTLMNIVEGTRAGTRGVMALEASGLLADALFHRTEVPRSLSLRLKWSEQLVQAVSDADLVFLDPDNGIQGSRLSPKHVALSEIAALRRQDRTLVFAQRHTGRRSEVNFLANQLCSIGCKRIELVRFRLVVSRFYVVTDHDEEKGMRIADFARKWGKWVKMYRL
jgi:hypothetical protein